MIPSYRTVLLMILDSIFIVVTAWIAHWFTATHVNPEGVYTGIIVMALAMLVFHHLYAFIFHLYKKVWAYASIGELVAIGKSTLFTIVSAGLVQYIGTGFQFYPRTVLVAALIYVMFIGGSRFMWRIIRDQYIVPKRNGSKKRTLLVGAGSAGAMIARQLYHETNQAELLPIGFVDDDDNKQNLQIYDVPVVGKVKDIPKLVATFKIDLIVIAIPSLRHDELNDIVDQCNGTKAKVQMIPRLEDLMTGRVSVNNIRNIEVDDLLGRKPVELDLDSIRDSITGEVIMITGAGGSIGAELCRQIIRFAPSKLLLVGHGEYSIYKINEELRENHYQKDVDIIPIIGDVKDRDRMMDIVATYRPRKIYHAAAHKHVPLMEYNPHEAVKNNIIGTRNVAEAAAEHQVHTFVLVSTDKAVNPTNVMGASKRIAEMVIQNLAKTTKTTFVAVRFGNVLGSRGSVIPRFKQQIERGGPVTVTHPDMTRYFMTIPESARLVIQAGTLARGGEIFVLDMGDPVKIADLAKRLIRLSGYTENDIKVEYTGIRPGEKMYEELLNEDEINPKQVFEKIYIGKTVEVNPCAIAELIKNFDKHNAEQLKDELMAIIGMEQQLKGQHENITYKQEKKPTEAKEMVSAVDGT